MLSKVITVGLARSDGRCWHKVGHGSSPQCEIEDEENSFMKSSSYLNGPMSRH